MTTGMRSRDFHILLGSYAFSAFGDQLALVALILLVHDSSSSGFKVGLLLLTELVPLILLTPVSGLVVDRFETTRLLAAIYAADCAVVVLLVFTHSLSAVFALAFALGVGVTITRPGMLSLIPTIVGEEHSTAANARFEMASVAAATAGPVLAGVIVAAGSYSVALTIDAASFGLLALAVLLIKARRVPSSGSDRTSNFRKMQAGFRVLIERRLVGLILVSNALQLIFAGITNIAIVFFAKDTLKSGDVGFGVCLTLWGVGMVVGAGAVGRWAKPVQLATTFLLASLLTGAALLGQGAAPSLPFAGFLFLLAGIGNGAQNVARRSAVHHWVESDLLGRVFAISGGLSAGAQLAAIFLGGLVVDVITPRLALVVSGVGVSVVALASTAIYLAMPQEERTAIPIEDVPPDGRPRPQQR